MGSGRARKFAAAVVAALLLASVCAVIVATAAPKAAGVHQSARPAGVRQMSYACAFDLYNARKVLHFATRPSSCGGSGHKLITFSKDAPVYTCRKEHGGFAARQKRFQFPSGIYGHGPAGLMRWVSSLSQCAPQSQPNETPVTLPSTTVWRLFCAAKRGGELRWANNNRSCNSREFLVGLPPDRSSPVAKPDSGSTDEDHGTTVNVLANDRNTAASNSNAGLEVDSTDTAGTKGTITVNPDGTIAYNTNGQFESLRVGQSTTDSFKYRVKRGTRTSAPATVTITVNGVNDLPVANNDSATTDSAHSKSIPVLANDTDADGDSLSPVLDTAGTQGNVTVNGDGTVTYDPNHKFDSLAPNSTAHDTFKYKANDGHGDSNVATVDVTIGGIDDPPVVTTSSNATPYTEGAGFTPVDAGVTVTDADSAQLTSARVAIVDGHNINDILELPTPAPGGITGFYDGGTGVLSLSGNTSAANWQAALRTVRFRSNSDNPFPTKKLDFKVNDGNSDSAVSTKTISVTGVNDAPQVATTSGTADYVEDSPPVAVDPSFDVSDPDSEQLQGATVSITGNFSSADGDTLNFTDQNGITHSYNSGTGVLTLTGAAGPSDYQNAIQSITFSNTSNNPSTATRTVSFKVNDGALDSNTATRDVTVARHNDSPAGTDQSVSTNEDTPKGITLAGTDPEGDSLTFGHDTTSANGGTISGAGSSVTYTPAPDYCSSPTPDTFNFTVNDGNGGTGTGTVSITVTCVNDAPVTDLNGTSNPGFDTTAAFVEDSGAVNVAPNADLSDVDNTSLASATITLVSPPDGSAESLSVTIPGGNPVTAGPYDSGTGVLTLTSNGATIAEMQAAVRAVKYNNTDDTPTTTDRTVKVKVNDGSADSNEPHSTVSVAAHNDAPTATGDGPYATNEDTLLNVAAPGVLGNDTDPEGNSLTAVLVSGPSHASTFALHPDGSFDYKPAQDYFGSDSFTYKANDGTDDSNTVTVDITVNAANDPPAVDLDSNDAGTNNSTASFSETNPHTGDGVFIAPNASVADVDTANMDHATITITNLVDTGKETLAADVGATGIVANYTTDTGAGTGTLSLTGSALPSAYEQVIKTIKYDNTKNPPSSVDRSITVVVNDGTDNSTTRTATVHVIPIDAAPTLDLNSADPSDDSSASFTEGAGATTLAPNAAVGDPDAGDNIESATVKITNLLNTGAETLTVDVGVTGIVANYTTDTGAGTGTLTLTGSKTPAVYQSVLQTVKYDNTSDTPNTTARTVTFVVNDGQEPSPTRTATVSVAATNDAPVNSVPGGQSLAEDGSFTFTGATKPSVSDADAGSDPIKVHLTVSHGKLDLSGTASLTVTGDGSADVSATGSQSDINTALDGLKYTPTANYNGSDSVHIVTDDQGRNPAPAQADTDDIPLTITAVNDAPANTVPSGQMTDEDIGLTFSSANSNQISVADADAAETPPGNVQVDLTVSHGTLTVAASSPPTVSGQGTNHVTLTGTTAQINTALDGLLYQPSSNYNGSDSLSVVTDDLGHTPAPAKSDTDPVGITINPVNDAPNLTADSFTGGNAAVGNTTFVARNTTASTNNPADGTPATPDPTDGVSGDRPHKTITGDILANDSDVESDSFSVTSAGTAASGGINGQTEQGGTVTVDPDGDFVVEPKPGTSCTNPNDSFTYKVTDTGTPSPASSTGTVSFVISGCVWYVNNHDTEGNSGTSAAPFDSLAGAAPSAENSSATGNTIFVYRGDGSTTGQTAGIDLKDNQKLVGEAADLKVGSDTLQTGGGDSKRPLINDTASNVVNLAAGNTVTGVQLDPQGGGGIVGGSGDVSGTIADVKIIDANTPGTAPSLDLVGTGSGSTYDVSDLTIDNTGAATTPANTATGVRLANAGIVNFASGGTISVKTKGAGAIDASNTGGATSFGAGSVFDDVVVQSTSNARGISLSGTTGTVTIGNSGTSDVSATGAAAVDVSGSSNATLSLHDVSSSGGTNGINFDNNGASTFSATGGTVSGATNGVRVNLGSGNFTYPGTFGDGTGATASITNRTNGANTFSGAINDGSDAGGGITVSGNSGGSTTFSSGTKTINTTTSAGAGSPLNDAVVLSSNTGHTINFTGGGLNIDSFGKGVSATGGGTLNISGSPNSINATSGVGLDVTSTTIGSTLNFHDISAGNNTAATDPTNGIKLFSTGNTAGLTVGGGGSATQGGDSSGGTIQHTTGRGIDLANTNDLSLNNMTIASTNNAGIYATGTSGSDAGVTNFSFTNGEISSAGDGGAVNTDNGISFNNQAGANTKNVDGTLTVTNDELLGNFGGGLTVAQNDGTISNATVNNNLITQATSDSIDAGGVQFSIEGTAGAAAGLTKGTFNNNTVNNARDNGIVLGGGNTAAVGAPPTTIGTSSGNPTALGTNKVTISGNTIAGDPANKMNTDGITVGSSGYGSVNTEIVSNPTITNLKGQALGIGVAGNVTGTFSVTGNTANPSNILGSDGLGINTDKRTVAATTVANPTLNAVVSGNTISGYDQYGIHSLVRDHNGTARVRIANNTVNAGTATSFASIEASSGSSGNASFNPTACYDITGNTAAQGTDGGAGNASGILMDKLSTSSTTYIFGIVGLSPSPATAAATGTFVGNNNPGSATGTGFYAGKRASADTGDNFTSCTLPF